jgi:hypothetical protein
MFVGAARKMEMMPEFLVRKGWHPTSVGPAKAVQVQSHFPRFPPAIPVSRLLLPVSDSLDFVK